MKNQLKSLFQSQFNLEQYTKLILSGLLHAQQIKVRPELLEETSDGDVVYGLGIMEDANRLRIGLFYTDVRYGDVTRKRVGLRRIVEPYIKANVDAALAVFDDGRHWRLSFVTDLQGKSTSPKRFSYVMGDPQGQYRTPVERLLSLNANVTRLKTPTLADIKDAFSVEALSDAFFDEYHIHYDRIVANLTQSYRRDVPWRVSTDGMSPTLLHDYVKKMMGRIVFLHFLQKKGWLNGNPSFLRDLFLSSPHQADFLEQVLEPLFFGIFNTEPEQREKLFASEHWDKDLLKQWEHLPYLNGGLFERDEVDKMNIRLPASLFNNLFTFLASYNFTVDENDPDDAEIGVDPEMLGKIFESLLEDNKAKGAFYTPKEIVRYMCKESLIAYLNEQCTMNNVQLSGAIRTFVETHEFPSELESYRDTLDRALREVKICDPAIGSGAFPMGLLNELWRCREAISIPPAVETQCIASLQPTTRAALKREIIENNIYGVDIERGAIDIARLRFWLSIVVDSEEPQALPNFDYKFMQGNSLIESFEGVDLSRMMSNDGQYSSLGKGRQKAGANQLGIEFASTDTKRNLQLMLREYFSITDHEQKSRQRSEINDSVKSYIRQQHLRPEAVARLTSLDPSANQEFFLWHTWFKEIFDRGGFDIVVANPPYVFARNSEEKGITPEMKRIYYDNFILAKYQVNLYHLFIEQGTKLLRTEGILSYIVPNNWLTINTNKELRKFVLQKSNIQIVNFYKKVFEKADVDSSIVVFSNKEEVSSKIKLYEATSKDEIDLIKESDCTYFLNQKDFVINIDLLKNSSFSNILNKIESSSRELKEISEIKAGLKAYETGKGTPPLTKEMKEARIYHSYVSKGDDWYRYLKGADVCRYSLNWSGEFLKYGKNLAAPRTFNLYSTPRILVRQIPSKLPYCINAIFTDDIYLNDLNSMNIINIKENPRFVLGILNSKAVSFWFAHKFGKLQRGLFPQFKINELATFPIPYATDKQQKSIIDLVDKILEIKCFDTSADTSALEREIDGLVYGLYGLTEEEIAVIERI